MSEHCSIRTLSTWYWMSFCDPDKPEGEQFLGVVIVDGGSEHPSVGIHMAAVAAYATGCNPGGEVVAIQLPQWAVEHVVPAWSNRLLTRAEVAELDAALTRVAPEAM